MPEPIVSVIIPTYNRAEMLTKSIDSVLVQDFDGFEVIVSDDGSSDNTLEVLSQYGDKIVVVSRPNAGCAAARNRAAQVARGELIAFHDSDDLMLPGRLSAQVEFMQAHPAVAAATGNVIIQGQEDRNYLEHGYGIDFGGQPWVIFSQPFPRLLYYNFMANPASMIKRNCFLEVGGIDESLRISSDWEFWLRVARRWPLACLNVPCTWLGKHEGNITASTMAEVGCNIRVMDRALRWGEPLDQQARRKILNRLFGLVRSYLLHNLTGPAEPLWRTQARRCAEHLPWPRRLLVGLITVLPRAVSGPPLSLMVKTRVALRGRSGGTASGQGDGPKKSEPDR